MALGELRAVSRRACSTELSSYRLSDSYDSYVFLLQEAWRTRSLWQPDAWQGMARSLASISLGVILMPGLV